MDWLILTAWQTINGYLGLEVRESCSLYIYIYIFRYLLQYEFFFFFFLHTVVL